MIPNNQARMLQSLLVLDQIVRGAAVPHQRPRIAAQIRDTGHDLGMSVVH
jgi:hypothetical protein